MNKTLETEQRPRLFLFDDRKKKAGCFRLVDSNDPTAQVVADIYQDDIATTLQAAPDLLAICEEIAADTSIDLVTSERRIRLYSALNRAGSKTFRTSPHSPSEITLEPVWKD